MEFCFGSVLLPTITYMDSVHSNRVYTIGSREIRLKTQLKNTRTVIRSFSLLLFSLWQRLFFRGFDL